MDIEGQKALVLGMGRVGPIGWPGQDGRPPPGFNGGQVPLDGGPDALLGEQWIFPAGYHKAFLSPQAEAQPVPMADLIALVLHEQEEVPQVVGVLDGLPQIRLQQTAEGGTALGLAEPLDVAHRLGRFPPHDNREPMFPAQPVRDGPDLLIVAPGVAVILLAGVCVDGVKEDMGMDVSFVHMDADDRLIAGQVLLRELPGDVQGQFRSQFVRTKGEDHVVVLDAVLLAIVPLGLQHLPHLPTRLTVHAGGKDLLLGLVPIKNITDAYIQAPLSGQNLGNRHLLFRHLVHQLINLVQQVQPAPGILRSGNPGVDATGDLVDVVANVMDLCAQGTDLLGRAGLDRCALDQAHQEGPLGQAAFLGLPAQELVLPLCEFYVKMVLSSAI